MHSSAEIGGEDLELRTRRWVQTIGYRSRSLSLSLSLTRGRLSVEKGKSVEEFASPEAMNATKFDPSLPNMEQHRPSVEISKNNSFD